MQIEQRVALVSGGASGLGAAVAQSLIAAGARVVIADRNEAAGIALAGQLGAATRFSSCDISNAADCQRAIDLALGEFGRLDILVNCAGVVHGEKIAGRDGAHQLEAFQRVIDINLVGSFNLLRLAAAAMRTQEADAGSERGVIINTASIAAFDGQIGQCAYAASKAGLVGLTLPAARELAPHGIRVMTIAPGIFKTPMMASLPDEVQQALGATVPFPNRLGDPGEFARLVLAIIDNPMLNGEVIRLDGALRMQAR